MMIAYFQKLEIFPNLQEVQIDASLDKQEFKEERLKIIQKNTAVEKRPNELRGMKLVNKQHFKFAKQINLLNQNPASDFPISSKVNFYINTIDNGQMIRKQQLMHNTKRKYKVTEIDIFGKFLRFFATKVPKQNNFSIRKKRIDHKKTPLLISIKDPFIKQLNHGSSLQNKENLTKIIQEMQVLLQAASEGKMVEQIYSQPISWILILRIILNFNSYCWGFYKDNEAR